MNSVRDWQRRK